MSLKLRINYILKIFSCTENARTVKVQSSSDKFITPKTKIDFVENLFWVKIIVFP